VAPKADFIEPHSISDILKKTWTNQDDFVDRRHFEKTLTSQTDI
jgi:hypothetical protein